jgi:hypothetical protein
MVIPPEGCHLTCPAHPEGHHVFGPGMMQSERNFGDVDRAQHQSQGCYDSTKPRGGTMTGDTIHDTWKISM